MSTVLNLISYSGGKDSGALALWLREKRVPNLRLVFCDTKWEHDETYEYVNRFSMLTGIPLVSLSSIGMHNLIKKKGRMPSVKARFCTEELKLKCFRDYVDKQVENGIDISIWVGTRAEESRARALHPMSEWSTFYDCMVYRPIKWLSLARVIGIHRKYGIPLNPLYSKGMTRVGCKLCIMARKAEVTQVALKHPEVFEEIALWEREIDSTWFRAGDIPKRFCTKFADVEKKVYALDAQGKPLKDNCGRKLVVERINEQVPIPTIRDAMIWALEGIDSESAHDVLSLHQCESKHNLCE